jgi:hypothetical protein
MTVTSPAARPVHPIAPPRPGGSKRATELDVIPTVDEAKRRLAAAAGRARPWLTAEGFAVFADAPTEDLGPQIYLRTPAE